MAKKINKMNGDIEIIVNDHDNRSIGGFISGIISQKYELKDIADLLEMMLHFLEGENVTEESAGIHHTRCWLYKNILRSIIDDYIDHECPFSVQEILSENDYIIGWLVDLQMQIREFAEVDSDDDEDIFRVQGIFTTTFGRLLKLDVFLSEKNESAFKLTSLIDTKDDYDLC